MLISIMKRLNSFDRYLSEGYDNICDYPTYKCYCRLMRKKRIRKLIHKLMFWNKNKIRWKVNLFLTWL